MSSNVRWYPCHSRAWSAPIIQNVTANMAIEVSAKTTCTFLTSRKYDSVAGIGSGSAGTGARALASDIKKPFREWPTMYFKLKAQRRTILIGNAAIHSIRLANTM